MFLAGNMGFGRWLVGGLLVGLYLVAPASAKEKSSAVNLKEWIEGPIRYIMRKSERKAFKGLDNDRDRALFIERFWSRRDPDPETLANPYRQLFWERVNQANDQFKDSSKPGWKTDRGKIYILYGAPNEMHEDPNLRTEGIAGGGMGVIRWIYEGRPGERMDMDPIVVVPFVRDGSGEYKVSYDPALSSVFFDPTIFEDKRNDFASRMREKYAGGGKSSLSVMLDLGKLQEVPPEEEVILERVETSESYVTDTVAVEVHNFFDGEDDRMVSAVTVDLSKHEGDEKPAVIARFAPVDTPDSARILGEDSFRVLRGHGLRLAQGRIDLAPGSYMLTVLVADPNDLTTGLERRLIDVPEPSPRMRFSDVVWASDLESLPYAALASYDEPFVVGPFRVLPKFDDVYTQGETIKLFFEVYGAHLPLRVSYQLEGLEDNGDWTRIGRPAIAEQHATAQGWELPTTDRWPLGTYRIRVEVEDSEGQLIQTMIPFELGSAGS